MSYLRSDGSLSALPEQDGERRHTRAVIRRPRGMPKPRTGVRPSWRQPLHFGTTFLPDGRPVAGHYVLRGGRFPLTTPPQILHGLQALGDDSLGLFGIKVSFKNVLGSHSLLAQGARAAGKLAPAVALIPGVGIPLAVGIGAAGKAAGKLASGKKIAQLRFGEVAGAAAKGAAAGAAVGLAKKAAMIGAKALFTRMKGGGLIPLPPSPQTDIIPAADVIATVPPPGPAVLPDVLRLVNAQAGVPSVTDIIPAADVTKTAVPDASLAQRVQDQAAQAAAAAQVAAERAAKTGAAAPGTDAAGGDDLLARLKNLLAPAGSAAPAGGGGGGSSGPAPDAAGGVDEAGTPTEAGLFGMSPLMLVGAVVLAVVVGSQGRRRGRR